MTPGLDGFVGSRMTLSSSRTPGRSARELIGKGIYVNALAPAFVETPGLQAPAGGAQGKTLSDLIQAVFGTILLDRLRTPEEIVVWAVDLASDDSNFMVGQVISPNGGQVV